MRRRPVRSQLALSLWVLSACATAAPPAKPETPGPPAPPPAPVAPVSERTREELQVAPWEIILSGVRGEAGPSEVVTARNLVERPVTVSAVKLAGEGAPLFHLTQAPTFPVTIPAKGSISVEVGFAPPAGAEAGLKRAVLRFQTGLDPDDGPAADLSALVLSGREPEAEPPLAQIVESLGFSIDVGGRTLQLVDAPESAGERITQPALFERARSGPVAINPVARFSADGPVAYGYYAAGNSLRNVDARPLGVMSPGQNQTLNPGLEPGGITSFDPGPIRFGLWVDGTAGGDRGFSEARRNRGKRPAAVRVYPLRARGGAPIPEAYLIAFGEAARGDYQDGVFVLWNVKLASP